jgi:hypothetical protein
MPTYIDAINEVQDDYLNRTDFNAQVRRAINKTIRHYNRERFFWNVTSTALVAVASQQTLALPDDFITEDRLEYLYAGTTNLQITQQSFDMVRKINCDLSTGTPSYYAIRGNTVYFANVPDSAYPITLYYVNRLPDLSADSDTNPYLDNAYDLVCAGAAKLVWATTIRNVSAAQVCAQLETDYVSELRRFRDQNLHQKIRATKF